ncbi:MAG: class I SAM-dependent methyltransferase [Trueperaceae bacterium]
MFTDKNKIIEQYQNSNNLEVRIALHNRFSTAKQDYHAWLFEHIEAQEGANVLELGTGSAKFWQVNRERIPTSWRITLSDISEGMLKDAQKNVATIGRDFSFCLIDAQEIPLKDSSLDVVIANSMLYHVPNVDKAIGIGEIRRVLKPAGRLYAATGGLILDDFATEHMASKLPGVFSHMSGITEQLALENSEAQLHPHFANVERHMPPKSHLHVTEAEPFIAYILSMVRWSELVEGTPKDVVDKVVSEAREIAKNNLPIHITTSVGLFEAW